MERMENVKIVGKHLVITSTSGNFGVVDPKAIVKVEQVDGYVLCHVLYDKEERVFKVNTTMNALYEATVKALEATEFDKALGWYKDILGAFMPKTANLEKTTYDTTPVHLDAGTKLIDVATEVIKANTVVNSDDLNRDAVRVLLADKEHEVHCRAQTTACVQTPVFTILRLNGKVTLGSLVDVPHNTFGKCLLCGMKYTEYRLRLCLINRRPDAHYEYGYVCNTHLIFNGSGYIGHKDHARTRDNARVVPF